MRLPSFRTIALSALVASVAIAAPAYAKNPNVGGAPMYTTKNIVENAVNSKDHTTLVAAVKAAGLVIYWAWNNLLSILQQGVIMKRQGAKIELWDNLVALFRKKPSPAE